ncbi:MAG: YicC/YloC family endoribonuclease [Boseongicola sp.]
MTGFASFQSGDEIWRLVGDIRSVNGRGLDLRIRVPDWVEGLEPEIRKRLQAGIGRGSVTLNVRVSREDSAPDVALNAEQLNSAFSILAEIENSADSIGLQLEPSRAADVAAMRGVIEQRDPGASDTSDLKELLLKEVDALLEAFNADRAREGAALGAVLNDQIEQVERLAKRATDAAGDRVEASRAAMSRSFSRLLEATEVPDETRLLQELALIAVKTDVTEELDRLLAHIIAAKDLLNQKGPVGRKLDFLMQEFNREANTLCSKSQSTELTSVGLDLKAVIDQMREQVQNVE